MKKNSRTNVVTLYPQELAVAVSFRIFDIEECIRLWTQACMADIQRRYIQKLIYLKGVRSELRQDRIPDNFDFPCDIA